MLLITASQFPALCTPLLTRMIVFMRALQHDVVDLRRFGSRGAPWDFNLRDLFRWCELMVAEQVAPHWRPWQFVDVLFLQRMRTSLDQIAIVKLYRDVFIDIPPSPSLQPYHSISRSSVQIGTTWLPRTVSQHETPAADASSTQLLHGQLRPLAALMTCVRMGWMCTVTGAAGAGKTCLTRFLAGLVGSTLREIVLSSSTDITELIGCFEQADPTRLRFRALRAVGKVVTSVTQRMLLASAAEIGEAENTTLARQAARSTRLAATLQTAWGALTAATATHALGRTSRDTTASTSTSAIDPEEWFIAHDTALEAVLVLLESAPAVATEVETGRLMARLGFIRGWMAQADELLSNGLRGKFVWVDGPIVSAMEDGSWLILENANLCNPSVLDRLNPLLERSGMLHLPESGLQKDGSVRKLAAHPAFRLFLTADPARGELSRAMRNRGVEVCMPVLKPAGRDMLTMVAHLTGTEGSLTVASAVSSSLPLSMVRAYTLLAGPNPESDAPTPSSVLLWAETTARRLERGATLCNALMEAACATYGARLALAADAVEWDAACIALAPAKPMATARGVWPPACGVTGFIRDAQYSTVCCEGSLLSALALVLKSSDQGQDAKAGGGREDNWAAGKGACNEDAAPLRHSADFAGEQSASAKVADLSLQLEAAVFEFVSRTTQTDTRARSAMLAQLSREGAVAAAITPSELVLKCAERLLAFMDAHPAFAAARLALRAACGEDSRLLALVANEPLDLQRLNPPMFELVRRAACTSDAPEPIQESELSASVAAPHQELPFIAKGTGPDTNGANTTQASGWRGYTRMLPRIRLLLQLEWDHMLQVAHVEHAMDTSHKAPECWPLLTRSYAHQAHVTLSRAARDEEVQTSCASSAWADLSLPLYPCLEEIHAVLRSLSALPLRWDGRNEELLVSSLAAVHAARRSLVACCSRKIASPSTRPTGPRATESDGLQPFQPFLVCWRAVHKRLARLAVQPLGLELPQTLQRACDRVSAAAHYVPCRVSTLLWKKTGARAEAPHSPVALGVLASIDELAAQLRVPVELTGAELLAERPTHLALWAGPALRRSVLAGCATVSAHSQVGGLPAMDTVREISAIPRELAARLAAEERRTSRVVAMGALPREMFSRASLWPLHDGRSIALEASLLLATARLIWIAANTAGEVGAKYSTRLQGPLIKFVESVICECGRSPLDAVPAQLLLWRLEAARQRPEQLFSSLCSLSIAWHEQMWREQHLSRRRELPIGGPVSLLLATEVPLVCGLLQHGRKTSLSRRAATLDLLLRLQCFLQAPRPSQSARTTTVTAAKDWRLLLHTLCLTLLALASTLSDDADRTELRRLLTVLYRGCDSSFRMLSGDEDADLTHHRPEAQGTRVDFGAAQVTAAVVGLRALLARSTEETLQSLLCLLVEPCLDVLEAAVKRIGTTVAALGVAGCAPSPSNGARGRGWALLGLLRWSLLLPNDPVDPALKYSLKARLLSAQHTSDLLRLRASELSLEVWNGARCSAALCEQRRDLASLKATITVTARRSCARPAPPLPQFCHLHSELCQWHSSLGARDQLLQLSADLTRGAATALAREVGWQASSDRFLRRLAQVYPGFVDITGPLKLAVYEVKHGLRLQAASVSTTTLAVHDGVTVGTGAVGVNSTMRALLVFPQSHAASYDVSAAPYAATGALALPEATQLPPSLLPLVQALPWLVSVPPPERAEMRSIVRRPLPSVVLTRRWTLAQHNRLLILALRRLYVMVLLCGRPHLRHVSALSHIMLSFVQAITGIENAGRTCHEEDLLLYTYKSKACGQKVEETEALPVFRQLFPDFSSAFNDLRELGEQKCLPVGESCEGDAVTTAHKAYFKEGDTCIDLSDEPDDSTPLPDDERAILMMLLYHEQVFRCGDAAAVGNICAVAMCSGDARDKRRNGLGGIGTLCCGDEAASDWRLRQAQSEGLAALHQAHSLASLLMPSLAPLLPVSLDGEARGALLALTCYSRQELEGRSAARHLISASSCAFSAAGCGPFHQDNGIQVSRLMPVVAGLCVRVRELLLVWPEHAGLQLVVQICVRLRSFRVDSPLMKFVVGVELLLREAWKWESVASSSISIKEHIETLAELVLYWRKMELDAWPWLLARTAQQEHEKALVVVWIRLFRLVDSHAWPAVELAEPAELADISNPSLDADHAVEPIAAVPITATKNGQTDREVRAKSPDKSTLIPSERERGWHHAEFFGTFELLMQGASTGAFEAYLRLLRAFGRQLRIQLATADRWYEAARSEGCKDGGGNAGAAKTGIRGRVGLLVSHELVRRRVYASILHHLSCYYRQFSGPLQASVSEMLAPIEQKLQDFVQLGLWSDRNYPALKQSTERSHQQLNRCVLQHRALLRMPAVQLLPSLSSKELIGQIEMVDGDEEGSPATNRFSKNEKKKTKSTFRRGGFWPGEAEVAGTLLRAGLRATAVPVVAISARETSADLLMRAAGGAAHLGAISQAGTMHWTRITSLSAKMTSFCERLIFSPGSSKRSEERRASLVHLREEVVRRAVQLRVADNTARQRKHKALIDLLRALTSIGLAHHASAADPRQGSMSSLFTVEAAKLDFRFASSSVASVAPSGGSSELDVLSACWQREWDRSTDLFYRCVLGLTRLRHTHRTAHEDLSGVQVHKAMGFVEHGFSLLLQQRDVVRDALMHAAALAALLARLELLEAVPVGDGDTKGGEACSEVIAGARSTALGPGSTSHAGQTIVGLPGIVTQRPLASALTLAHVRLDQLVHISVESAGLFEVMATSYERDGANDVNAEGARKATERFSDACPGLAIRGAAAAGSCSIVLAVTLAALRRSTAALQAAQRSLPHVDPAGAGAHILLTVAGRQALRRVRTMARDLHSELNGIAARLSGGLRSHLGPLLVGLQVLAEANDVSFSAMVGSGGHFSADHAHAPAVVLKDCELARPFIAVVEASTVQLMLAMQGLRQHAASLSSLPKEGGSKDNGRAASAPGANAGDTHAHAKVAAPRPGDSVVLHTESIRLFFLAARAPQLYAGILAVVGGLGALGDASSAAQSGLCGAAVLQALGFTPALRLHLACMRWGLHQALGYHGELMRLELIMLNLFSSLFASGFCSARPDHEHGAGSAGMEGKFDQDTEGAGMGEGQGKTDVSEHLQDEGQIEGDCASKTQEQKEIIQGNEERAKEGEGVEMESEFDGKLKNVEQENEQICSDDQPQSDDPEHIMGQLDQENQEVLDERLWQHGGSDELPTSSDEKVNHRAEAAGEEAQLEATVEKGEPEPPWKKQRKEQQEVQSEDWQIGSHDERTSEGIGGDGEGVEGDNETKCDYEAECKEYMAEDEVIPGRLLEGNAVCGQEEGGMGQDCEQEKQQEEEEQEGIQDKVQAKQEGGEEEAKDCSDGLPDEAMQAEEDSLLEDSSGVVRDPDDGPVPTDDRDCVDRDPLDGFSNIEEQKLCEEDGAETNVDMKVKGGGEEEKLKQRQQQPQQQEQQQEQQGQPQGQPQGQQQEQRQEQEEPAAAAANRCNLYDRPRPCEEAGEVSNEVGALDELDAASKDELGDVLEPFPQPHSGPPADALACIASSGSSPPPPRAVLPQRRVAPQPNAFHQPGDALDFYHKQLALVDRDQEDSKLVTHENSTTLEGESVTGERHDEPISPCGQADVGEFELACHGEHAELQVLADATQEQLEDGREIEAGTKESESSDLLNMVNEAELAQPDAELPAQTIQSTKEPANMQTAVAKSRPGCDIEPAKGPIDSSVIKEVAGESMSWSDSVNEAATAGKAIGGHIGATRGDSASAIAEADTVAPVDDVSARHLQDVSSDLDAHLANSQLGVSVAAIELVWRRFEARTFPLSQELCEQLRLILEATIASKLQGDYRTGKRISMRKVIPYIASGYRKDKIWLRRTKPHKRNYQVRHSIQITASQPPLA